MDRHNTKHLIGQSFIEQLKKHPFEKITIKMITDGAGVIRPTFYNYFKDKNDVFEWILDEYLINAIKPLIDNDMKPEVIKVIFKYFDNNRHFYKKAFSVEGQNSFEEILTQKMFNTYLKIIEKEDIKTNTTKIISPEIIAKYYSIGIVYLIKMWIVDDNNFTAEDMYEAYIFLITHSLLDIIEKQR